MRPRSVWRIARWEAVGGGAGIDRRALGLAALAVVALALLIPIAAGTGPAADEGLYRVGIAETSPYHAPADSAAVFAIAEPDPRAFARGHQDLLVRGATVRVQDTPTGRAAAAALRDAIERYNDRLMANEPDQAAAFPVEVELRYVERDVNLLVGRAEGGGADGGTAGGASAGDTDDGTPDGDATPTATGNGSGAGSVGGLGGLAFRGAPLVPEGSTGTPSSIAPPFPFASLVLAFAFVVPMNFVVQAYASSVLHDRGNRRGEPLLVVPVSKWTLIVGKALPYFALMLAIAAGTAWFVGGGWLSLLAVVPIAALFLAGGFLAGLLARSHKELTFVLVTVAVCLTSYVFVPAIFADIHPIAAISPLSLVVRDLEGSTVTVATLAFSTLPALLAAAVLYGLGGGLYNADDLFAQLPLPAKALDALAAFVTSPRRAGLASVLSIPFVFLAELLAIALLFALPPGVALAGLFVAVATIEEVAKSLPAYAGFRRGRFARSRRAVVAVGLFSGFGFFLGEKLAVAAQLVGLFELDLGHVAFELGAGVGGAATPALLALVLLAPLGLHVVTATITALGAGRDAVAYAVALTLAIAVHAAYNIAVVVIVG